MSQEKRRQRDALAGLALPNPDEREAARQVYFQILDAWAAAQSTDDESFVGVDTQLQARAKELETKWGFTGYNTP